jgi:hypothetical protein
MHRGLPDDEVRRDVVPKYQIAVAPVLQSIQVAPVVDERGLAG